MPARVQDLPKPPADLRWNKWIRAVRDALSLSEERFAEAIGAGGRDTVAKWMAKKPQEPGFIHTRRIVTIAPISLVGDFIGTRAAAGLGLDRATDQHVDRTRGGTEGSRAMKDDATFIAGKLDAIKDDDTRSKAVEYCLAAIRKAESESRHPPELGADTKPARAQSK